MLARVTGTLILIAVAACLAVLNWNALGAPLTLDLGLLHMDVSIGAVVLAFSGLLVGAVVLYQSATQAALIRMAGEQRDELRALHERAERQPYAELNQLHELMADGLDKVHGRFDDAQARLSRLSQQFRTANDELRLDIQQLGTRFAPESGDGDVSRDRAQPSFMRMPDGSRAAMRVDAR